MRRNFKNCRVWFIIQPRQFQEVEINWFFNEVKTYVNKDPLDPKVQFQNTLLTHSVLEQIQIKGSYLDQRPPQHESLYPIGLKSARIEIPQGGSHYIDFSKTDFY